MSIETRMFALAIGGIALLTVMDAIAKALASDYGTFQIVFARFAFSALWIGAAALVVRHGWPRRDRLSAHGLRALLMIATTSAFFYALGHLPLAEVFVLTYTAPIFVALFGALLIGEKVDRITVAAIACGFAGVVWVALGDAHAGDGAPRPWFALACAIASPVTYALGNVLLRAQTAHEPVLTIVLTQSLIVSALLLPVAVYDFAVPTLQDSLLFAALGLFGAGGYLAFASAIAKLPAARVAVADYSGLIWAALLGYVLFAEVPKPSLWAGAVLILGGSLLMLRAKKPKPA
ncbi:MAG: DMT family transporter [Telmatospirillum sp.]|nr:DMT family transporter [Telmatospirillum sp.]